jgi:hypothetical protein
VRVVLNVALRLSIIYFLAEVLAKPDDPRFAGKAIPIRNLIVAGGLTLLFPVLHAMGKCLRRGPAVRWQRYPWSLDSLYLSIFWLDMAGNSFNLYDRYTHFDLIPHFHGTGATALVLRHAFDVTPQSGVSGANIIHLLLEIQEFLTDVFFETHNVRGWWDTAGDLGAGLVGTWVYTAADSGLRTRASGVLDH